MLETMSTIHNTIPIIYVYMTVPVYLPLRLDLSMNRLYSYKLKCNKKIFHFIIASCELDKKRERLKRNTDETSSKKTFKQLTFIIKKRINIVFYQG